MSLVGPVIDIDDTVINWFSLFYLVRIPHVNYVKKRNINRILLNNMALVFATNLTVGLNRRGYISGQSERQSVIWH